MSKTSIHVTCAIIEYNGLVLAAKRSPAMNLPHKWEFLGGKIEPGEDPRACLQREIHEELGMDIAVKTALPAVNHQYPDFGIILYPFVCSAESDFFSLQEHAKALWLKPEALQDLDWAEADLPVLAAYQNLQKGTRA